MNLVEYITIVFSLISCLIYLANMYNLEPAQRLLPLAFLFSYGLCSLPIITLVDIWRLVFLPLKASPRRL